MKTIHVQVLRTDGRIEDHDVVKDTDHDFLKRLEALIDSTMFDTVYLGNGRCMFVDDDGYMRAKPLNVNATKLYHEHVWTRDPIVGDVIVFRDGDIE